MTYSYLVNHNAIFEYNEFGQLGYKFKNNHKS